MESITLFIAHPDRIVRESLSTVLSQQGRLAVLGTSEGNDLTRLLASLRELRADIVILDVAVARRCGPAFIAEMKSPRLHARVLVTGIPDSDADILAVIEIGATGYETRKSSLRDLISNIHALMSGQTLCSPRIARMLFSRIASQPQRLTSMRAGRGTRLLTRRELEIISLIDAGLANKEIARRLSLEVQTVKNHVHNILEKLNVRGRIEAARYVRAEGLLSGTTSSTTL